MRKGLRIIINILILLVVAGFVWYMISSLSSGETLYSSIETEQQGQEAFVNPYTKEASFEVSENIKALELVDNKIYIAADNSVMIYDLSGVLLARFEVNGVVNYESGTTDEDSNPTNTTVDSSIATSATAGVRDIVVSDNLIYLLFPTSIKVYSPEGREVKAWEACSDNSNYCSLTLSSGFVFVTDADNKNICKYTTDGNFVKFIQSPRGFVIPNFSFDIDTWNDTIYCVNAGRQQIETYTTDGDFIASFGHPGGQPGAFSGCCNPVYILFTPEGDILTSEKGNPRVCVFEKNGRFKNLLLNSKMLGGGNNAYDIKICDNKLYVALNKTVSIFKR
jgi:hypothetical protein